MKALRILTRNIRDSFKGVFRNFSLSLASISCITITLIVVSIAMVLSYNVDNFTEKVEKNVTIVSFLDVDITQEQIDDVLEAITEIDGIESCSFKSKKDIAEDFMSQSDIFKNIMEKWTDEESPLQPTYEVKVKKIEDISSIANKIKKIDHVDIVRYGEDSVEQLVGIFDVVRKICVGIVIALIVVTAFLITNTIKITIFSRKKEIDIMRLVGASNINIKIPFVFEGLILGLLGSIIPILITIYGYQALYTILGGKLFSPIIELISPTPFVYIASLVLLIIGMVVGMIGSGLAVRKHLKI